MSKEAKKESGGQETQPALVTEKKVKKIEKKSLGEVCSQAFGSAFRGGIPGLIAMAVQVLALMWMRTLVNYQYSKGGSFGEAFTALYAEGGIPRFYNGLLPALITGPLSRFGDVAANEGILSLAANFGLAGGNLMWLVTMAASAGAAMWRIVITPVSNVKVWTETPRHSPILSG